MTELERIQEAGGAIAKYKTLGAGEYIVILKSGGTLRVKKETYDALNVQEDNQMRSPKII